MFRKYLKYFALLVPAIFIFACAGETEIVEVIKEVPVEKEVIKEVEVEKIIIEEKEGKEEVIEEEKEERIDHNQS